jgi:hypothetical protein
LPKSPTSEVEVIADEWFQSTIPQIPDRTQYLFNNSLEGWSVICRLYQHAILNDKEIAYRPIDVSLRIITESTNRDYFAIDKVIAVAVNSENLTANKITLIPPEGNRDIVTVVVSYSRYHVQFETRTDFVYENDLWQIRWIGNRWRCITDAGNESWSLESAINCP